MWKSILRVWGAVLVLTVGVFAQEGADETGPRGSVPLQLTFNVTPNPGWEPDLPVFLYADVRRNPEIQQEDIFHAQRYPGTYPRTAGQHFDFVIPDAKPGEKVLVQGYMCAQGTTDCYPSDSDNPPSCAVEVHVLGGFRPSCQPVFTWTGGEGAGGGPLPGRMPLTTR